MFLLLHHTMPPALLRRPGSLLHLPRHEGILLHHLEKGETALAVEQGADGAQRLSFTLWGILYTSLEKALMTCLPPSYNLEGWESPFFGWIPEEMSECG